ncbi:conserved protein of unknown function [Rhodovastum atsumiense]|uniref:Histidine kinase-like sensor domain-containing protein n=1 Tax=Rhodovastum atsumiense TaxID=504468 RepID=A0A5M6J2M6_9PROT|nr:hybrid sensor histidine kinase/response regulator [Rhodovastum atsumiense]KAA5613848.1 hypothetical protein F1189_03475 [Rhodovastum atsumiense]CAH2601962.1 conserved protein of unknown function [Rhodovastum atsumiense]
MRKSEKPGGKREDGGPTLRRLWCALVASVVVPLLLFAGAAWFDLDRLIEDATDDGRRIAAVLREHTLKAIETHELLLRQVERLTGTLGWEEIRARSAALSAELVGMQAGLPQVSALSLADGEGRAWVASVPVGGAEDIYSVAHREFWMAQRDADRGTFISRAYVGRQTQRFNFGISRRRGTADGGFDGVAVVAVTVGYFTDFWTEATRGKSGAAVLLVRDDGEVLARSPSVSASLPRLAPPASLLMQHLQAGAESGVIRSRSTIDGVERITAFARVGRYPVTVTYGIPVAVIQAEWGEHLLWLGTVCLLAAAALVCTVLSAMRQARRLIDEQSRRATAEIAAWQAQRMELLGDLAAEVARDFANMVQVVDGVASLLRREAGSEHMSFLANMLDVTVAGGRTLTSRLCAFVNPGEDGGERVAAVAPAEAVGDICAMLSRGFGPACRLRCEIEAGGLPRLVRGGRAGLEAAVIRLVGDARDALHGQGEVVVRVTPERVSQAGGLAPGLYARVEVMGIAPGLLPGGAGAACGGAADVGRAGRTGPPLDGVRGFAERAGGALWVEAGPGRARLTVLWLPAVVAVPIGSAAA